MSDLTDFSFIRTPTTLSLLPPISELYVDDDTTAQPGRLSGCLLLSSLQSTDRQAGSEVAGSPDLTTFLASDSL